MIGEINSSLRTFLECAQGYALIEYKQYEEALKEVQEMNGATVMEQKVGVSWAFKPAPAGATQLGGMGRKVARVGGGCASCLSFVLFFSFVRMRVFCALCIS